MVQGLGIILACQLVGDLLVTIGRLPIPAPVCGMLLLLMGLLAYGSVPESLARAADGLTSNMSLLFVPAGVGAVTQLGVIHLHASTIALVLAAGSLLTLIATAGVVEVMSWCIAALQRWSATRSLRGHGRSHEGPSHPQRLS
ncbi:MAG: CidA/LrgA family protein [Hyphomicrobiaceae bacterium]|nr:CidA/LrgA family protein [Hyphomicrobiaceae bacterium]